MNWTVKENGDPRRGRWALCCDGIEVYFTPCLADALDDAERMNLRASEREAAR